MFAKRGAVKNRRTKEASSSESEKSDKDIKLPEVKKARTVCHHFTTKKDDSGKEKLTEEFSYKVSGKLHTSDQKAVASADWDTAKEHDARAVYERNEEIGKKLLTGELASGVYRGQGAYVPVAQRREGAVAATKYTGAYGPIRATTHARMTMRIDYQPDICKDYKETGYCGFGDTCKFLHDRSDYKSGWQIEKEWDKMQKKKSENLRRRAEGLPEEKSESESD